MERVRVFADLFRSVSVPLIPDTYIPSAPHIFSNLVSTNANPCPDAVFRGRPETSSTLAYWHSGTGTRPLEAKMVQNSHLTRESEPALLFLLTM